SYLRRGELFAGLTPEQNQRASQFLQSREDVKFFQVDPKQAIFRQGNEADRFYIICLGNVAIQLTSDKGHTTTLNYLGRGQSFGEIGLLSSLSKMVGRAMPAGLRGKRTTGCVALDHVELVAIPREAFEALLASEPAIKPRLEELA